MPKVTQEYRDARRGQILDAAVRCFLRDGFHETSMQDLFDESGLSAGAVYRYFPGKEDMILAIAEQNLREVIGLIHTMAGEPCGGEGVGAALATVLEIVREKHRTNGLGALAVLVWSEALRNPDLATRFTLLLDELRGDLAEVVRAHQQRGTLPRDADPEALARLIVMVVPGFILQLALAGEDAVDGIPEAARALWS